MASRMASRIMADRALQQRGGRESRGSQNCAKRTEMPALMQSAQIYS